MKCTIEIPTHSYIKYEIKDNKLLVDRIIDYPYPANYGFVNNTLWDDGDALDVFVLGLPLHPTSQVEITPFAVIEMYDKGVSDYKLLASFNPKQTLKTNMVETIVSFLRTYKKGTEIRSVSIREKDIEKVLERAYNQEEIKFNQIKAAWLQKSGFLVND